MGNSQLTGTKDQLGANDTPDDTGVVKGAGVGAGQTLGLVGGADAVDVASQEVVGGNLHNGQPDDGKGLGAKHAAGRDLHVVADLHVGHVGEAVVGHHVAPGLEEHHGDGAAGQHVAEDHLGDDVETGLLVGDGLDHADGDEEEEADEDTDDESPPGEMRWPDEGRNHAESEANDKDAKEPPFRCLLILTHELEVDIGLLGAGVDGSAPDVGAVEEGNVGDGGDETGKAHAVGQRKGGAQQDGRVLAVGGQVDGEVGVEDAARVVGLGVVVKVLVGAQGQVAVELGAGVGQADDAEQHDEDAGGDVGNGKGRGLQGREQETGDDGPVKGDGQETQAGVAAKDLVDDDVVGGDPAGEHEELEELGKDLGNPLPDKGAGGDDEEEAVAANLPAVGHGRVGGRVVVQRVHDGGGDEHSGPHHGRGPDEEASGDASNAEAHGLGGEDEEDLEAPAELLVVEDFLGQQDVDGVGGGGSGSGHHGDDGVLLDVEGTGVELKLVSKDGEPPVGDNTGPEAADAACAR